MTLDGGLLIAGIRELFVENDPFEQFRKLPDFGRLHGCFETLERSRECVVRSIDGRWPVVLRFQRPAGNRRCIFSGHALRTRPHGPGQVGALYPKYRLQKPGLAPHGEVVPDLHSLPVHWLFQYGIVGLGIRAAVIAPPRGLS
jgi:hypothetical protein